MIRTLLRPPGLVLVLGLLGLGFVLTFWSGTKQSPAGSRGTGTSYDHSFEPLHGTDVRGRLKLDFSDTDLLLRIRLRNAQPSARYNTHLHRGRCRTGGSGGLQLTPVKIRSGDTGFSRSRVRYDRLNPTFDHLVMVHRPDQQHILCADVPPVPTMRKRGASGGSSGE